jgi:ABC-2 type transport system ATP-binding protein
MSAAPASEVPAVPALAMSPPVIQVEGIRHRYDERLALDSVTFEVSEAEIFGLLGPNGSGKTTLFRILSTLMLPEAGRAVVHGRDAASDASGVRREIGVVFQARSVDVKLTVSENLRHQGHLYGLRGAGLEARIREMLERLGVAGRADERVEKLSGGMQRRVELAKGLLHRPSVLLMDEPSTGLDPGARRDLWQYLAMLRESERVTIVTTTHLMEEAERCDRLAILNEGRLVALGTPAELKNAIGGDVILLDARDPERTATRLAERFRVQPTVIDGRIRLEREGGHRFVNEVMEAFPGEIRGISVSEPTLEDVFIDRTGHRFWNEEQEQ